MSKEKAVAQLERLGAGHQIIHLEESIATVPMAAQALKTQEQRIAKTLAFDVKGDTVLVVTAGDQKVDNPKYKAFFGAKATMLRGEETLARTHHEPGGVCPFGVPSDVKIYLDVSLKRFETVFPSCGDLFTAAELTPSDMERLSGSLGWVDVCKPIA